jgi:hypothetical protein
MQQELDSYSLLKCNACVLLQMLVCSVFLQISAYECLADKCSRFNYHSVDPFHRSLSTFYKKHVAAST